MKYTILVDEGADISVKELIKKFKIDNKTADRFLIPVYSYVICKGAIDIKSLKGGNKTLSEKIIKQDTNILDIGTGLDHATLLAIKKGLHYLISRNLKDEVLIYSDRKGVINNINSEGKYYKEIEILMKQFKKIHFTWIKRDCNSYADKLIKKGKMNFKNNHQISLDLLDKILIKYANIKEINEFSNIIYDNKIDKRINYLECMLAHKQEMIGELRDINKQISYDLEYYKKKSDYLDIEIERSIKGVGKYAM